MVINFYHFEVELLRFNKVFVNLSPSTDDFEHSKASLFTVINGD